MRNLMAGWINEETSSNDKSEPVHSVKNQDGSAQANLNGQTTKMIMDTGCKYKIISSQL